MRIIINLINSFKKAAVTIFGNVEEAMEIKKDVRELEAIVHSQRKTIDRFEERIKEIERQFNERLNDFYADYEAQMSDDVPEEIENEKG